MRRALLALIALLGCSKNVVESNGIPVHAKIWARTEAEVSPRARIDLGCPAIEVLLVSRQGKFPVEVSAEGCGRTALYHRQLRKHLGHSTTKNTVWELVTRSGHDDLELPQNAYETAAE